MEVKALSAGLNAFGGPPTPEAIETMREEGIGISGFSSRQLTEELVEEADLILTMTTHHKDEVLSRHPEAKQKVFTLKEFAGETQNLDIEDPYGEGMEAYKKCAKEIKQSLGKAFKKIFEEGGIPALLSKTGSNLCLNRRLCCRPLRKWVSSSQLLITVELTDIGGLHSWKCEPSP